MRTKIFGSLLALLGCTSVSAAGLYLYEIASPDMGMAGAGQAANALDASTTFTNPAGMVLLKPRALLVGVQPSFSTLEFEPNALTTVSGNNGGEAGLNLPSAGIYYAQQFSDCAWWGVNLNSYAALGTHYDPNWVGRYYVRKNLLLTDNINPVAAYAFNEWFSIGGGLTLQAAYLNQKSTLRNALDAIPDGQMQLRGTSWSWGYNIGVLFQIDLEKRIGLSYRSKIKQTFDDIFSLEGVGPLFSDALNSRGFLNPDVDLTQAFPEQVMLSMHYGMGRQWAFLFDWGWQHWSQYGTEQILITSSHPDNIRINLNFVNTWHYAFGVTYKFCNAYKWTAGIAYDSSPVSEAARSVLLPLDRQWRYAIGFQWEYCPDIVLGIAYEFLDAGKAPFNQDLGPLAGRVAGEYKHNYVQFLNFTVNWQA